jgi:hypothetical protein
MGGLWPVFGLLVLTIEWVVLRRVAPRLPVRSLVGRALVGVGAGFALSFGLAVLGLVVLAVAASLPLAEDNLQVTATAGSVMFVTGFLFSPIAAAFGAILLAVERYRVAPEPNEGPTP